MKVDETHRRWLADVTGRTVGKTVLIQQLWSGYGACFRAQLNKDSDGTTVKRENIQHMVVKCVQPPTDASHPRGWSSRHAHERKIRSFDVEHYFYTNLQPRTDENCKTPHCIAHDNIENNSLLVLEDLDVLGFSARATSLSIEQALPVIKWLAHFHATFLSLKNERVWKDGTYWHLSTRLDEFDAMPDTPLKHAARDISDALDNAKFKTLLHGDAKVANFCFTPAFDSCAAVDFQYTGHGVGVKDVAYFIGSALSKYDQLHGTDICINYYFTKLRSLLTDSLGVSAFNQLEQEWRQLYPFACADFYRFLAGWSPDHWKINGVLDMHSQHALKQLEK
ncbi:DUF1679 domain-containing protein [Alteromonas sp.]|jgi:hypothetical protein|nr:DUF1679 domain-containing protein [Alteromonas sp.]